MTSPAPKIDLAGVGSPIMDLVALVPDSFLANVAGEKGGMVLVDAEEMGRIVALLDTPPAVTTGGSAANATYNAATQIAADVQNGISTSILPAVSATPQKQTVIVTPSAVIIIRPGQQLVLQRPGAPAYDPANPMN